MSTVALDDAKVAQEPCAKAEEIEIIGRDFLTLGIIGGVNGMLDMMAVDREDGDPLQLRKASEEIRHASVVPQYQLTIQLLQHLTAVLLMKAVKERGSSNGFVEDLAQDLEKVAPAGDL
jgi:hypothetical protein